MRHTRAIFKLNQTIFIMRNGTNRCGAGAESDSIAIMYIVHIATCIRRYSYQVQAVYRVCNEIGFSTSLYCTRIYSYVLVCILVIINLTNTYSYSFVLRMIFGFVCKNKCPRAKRHKCENYSFSLINREYSQYRQLYFERKLKSIVRKRTRANRAITLRV